VTSTFVTRFLCTCTRVPGMHTLVQLYLGTRVPWYQGIIPSPGPLGTHVPGYPGIQSHRWTMVPRVLLWVLAGCFIASVDSFSTTHAPPLVAGAKFKHICCSRNPRIPTSSPFFHERRAASLFVEMVSARDGQTVRSPKNTVLVAGATGRVGSLVVDQVRVQFVHESRRQSDKQDRRRWRMRGGRPDDREGRQRCCGGHDPGRRRYTV
jgi:hypothetical protein